MTCHAVFSRPAHVELMSCIRLSILCRCGTYSKRPISPVRMRKACGIHHSSISREFDICRFVCRTSAYCRPSPNGFISAFRLFSCCIIDTLGVYPTFTRRIYAYILSRSRNFLFFFFFFLGELERTAENEQNWRSHLFVFHSQAQCDRPLTLGTYPWRS